LGTIFTLINYGASLAITVTNAKYSLDPYASNPTVNGVSPVTGEGGEILTRVQRYFSKKEKS
jgi:hypothetical protein